MVVGVHQEEKNRTHRLSDCLRMDTLFQCWLSDCLRMDTLFQCWLSDCLRMDTLFQCWLSDFEDGYIVSTLAQ